MFNMAVGFVQAQGLKHKVITVAVVKTWKNTGVKWLYLTV